MPKKKKKKKKTDRQTNLRDDDCRFLSVKKAIFHFRNPFLPSHTHADDSTGQPLFCRYVHRRDI